MTSETMSPAVLERIARARLLPVLRLSDTDNALSLAHRLIAAGLDVLEVTTSVPGWEAVIRRLRGDHPEVCVGAGTVVEAAAARKAVAAGAAFCVSPCLASAVREVLPPTVPLIEGGFTPTEVLGSIQHGVAKLFPAHVGGVAYLRSLLAVAPAARIIPTGGIRLADVRAWLEAGAFAVGVGGDLATAPDLAAQVREVLSG